jgi:hypothetical protein
MTTYRIVYEIAHRVREINIDATSPMLALKKFKEIIPSIIYKNLSVHEIKTDEPINVYTKRWDKKYCFTCEPNETETIKHHNQLDN